MAGLAVKARVTKFAADELWDEPLRDLDWDKEWCRIVIDAVIETASMRIDGRA